MKFKDQTFNDETISLDSNSFEGCSFNGCTITYAGGPLSFSNNKLDSCAISFADAAANTLQFMTAFYHAGGQDIIECTFDNIRRGSHGIIVPDE